MDSSERVDVIPYTAWREKFPNLIICVAGAPMTPVDVMRATENFTSHFIHLRAVLTELQAEHVQKCSRNGKRARSVYSDVLLSNPVGRPGPTSAIGTTRTLSSQNGVVYAMPRMKRLHEYFPVIPVKRLRRYS
jgi:hypothetical protein